MINLLCVLIAHTEKNPLEKTLYRVHHTRRASVFGHCFKMPASSRLTPICAHGFTSHSLRFHAMDGLDRAGSNLLWHEICLFISRWSALSRRAVLYNLIPNVLMEKAFAESWSKILDALDQAVMVVAADRTILFVNSAMESLSGYSADVLTGSSCTVLDSDSCFPACTTYLPRTCAALEGAALQQREQCLIMRKDGVFVPALHSVSLLKDLSGDPVGTIETFTDLSKLEKRDRQIQWLVQRLKRCVRYDGAPE